MSDINDLKNEVYLQFDNQKNMKFYKALGRYVMQAQLSPQQQADFYVELSKRNPDYFMDHVYPGLQMASQYRPAEEVNEINEYVLKKYCLLEGEEILATFYGTVSEKKTTSTGKIHLTNYRLISLGRQITRSAQKKVQVGRPSITGMIIRSGITRHRKAVQRAIVRAFHKDLKDWDLPEWGYYYPIYHARKIKGSNKAVSYIVDVETEKKAVSVSITITPLRLKIQSKDEFAKHRDYIINLIGQTLTDYQ